MAAYHWLLFFHLLGAFCFVAGAVVAGTLQLAAMRRERPSEILLLLRLTRAGVLLVVLGAVLTLGLGMALARHSRRSRRTISIEQIRPVSRSSARGWRAARRSSRS